METRTQQCPQPAADGRPGRPGFDVFARNCPSRPTLEHITGRWGGLVLGVLHEEPLRFAALRRRVDGVSEKMLSQTLQFLERDGFVHREASEGFPSRVEYSLTPLGRTIAGLFLDLVGHLEANMTAVTAAQTRYDQDHEREHASEDADEGESKSASTDAAADSPSAN